MEEFIILWNEWVFKLVVVIINAIIGGFIIPFILQLIKKSKDKRMHKFFKVMVKAAEQEFGGSSGTAKRSFVTREAKKKYGLKLDLDTIDAYIQDAVKELKEDGKEYKTQTKHQKEKYIAYNKSFETMNYAERESKVTREDVIPKKRVIK